MITFGDRILKGSLLLLINFGDSYFMLRLNALILVVILPLGRTFCQPMASHFKVSVVLNQVFEFCCRWSRSCPRWWMILKQNAKWNKCSKTWPFKIRYISMSPVSPVFHTIVNPKDPASYNLNCYIEFPLLNDRYTILRRDSNPPRQSDQITALPPSHYGWVWPFLNWKSFLFSATWRERIPCFNVWRWIGNQEEKAQASYSIKVIQTNYFVAFDDLFKL